MRTEPTQCGLGDLRGQPGAGRGDVRRAPGQDGVTRRGQLHESGSLRVRFPSPEADGLSAVFVNTAGGIAGGDRFDIDIAAGEGARLTLTTAAAEKVYRAHGPAAQLDIALKAAGRRASRLAAAGDHPVRPRAGRAAHRHRSGRGRLAAALRNRGVRPRRDGRDACCTASSSTAGGCAAAAGWSSPKPSGSTATSAPSWRGRRSPMAASPSAPR